MICYSHSIIRFQNPSYDRSNEVEIIFESVVSSELSPGQHEYVHPILDDNFMKVNSNFIWTRRVYDCTK